jgi:hypothetical protein
MENISIDPTQLMPSNFRGAVGAKSSSFDSIIKVENSLLVYAGQAY